MLNRRIRALALTIVALGFPAVPVNRGAAYPTMTTSAYCLSLGDGRLECTASVSGGVPPYTYNWSPDPISPWTEDEYTVVPCSNPVYNLRTETWTYKVSLTVTDSYGATNSLTRQWSCGEAP